MNKLYSIASCSILALICLGSDCRAQDPYTRAGYPATTYPCRHHPNTYRHLASKPVTYSFPVNRDLTAIYGASTYPGALNHFTGNPAYPTDATVAVWRPPHAISGVSNATPVVAGYAPTPAPQRIDTSNGYFVGQTMAGPPRVYVRNQPVRNFFRYLFP